MEGAALLGLLTKAFWVTAPLISVLIGATYLFVKWCIKKIKIKLGRI